MISAGVGVTGARVETKRPMNRSLPLSLLLPLALASGCGGSSSSGGATYTPVVSPASESALPQASVGAIYSAGFTIQEPNYPPHTVRSLATLPNGLNLVTTGNASFSLTGTPTNEGSSDIVLQVEDSFGFLTDLNYTLQIAPNASALTISPTTLPTASLNASYSATLTETNSGTTPYTWSLASGALPSGLTLSASGSGNTTTISGTPTTAGVFTFTVQVQDSTSTVRTGTQSYSLTVQ